MAPQERPQIERRRVMNIERMNMRRIDGVNHLFVPLRELLDGIPSPKATFDKAKSPARV